MVKLASTLRVYISTKVQEDGPVKRFQSRARISVLVDVAVSVIIS